MLKGVKFSIVIFSLEKREKFQPRDEEWLSSRCASSRWASSSTEAVEMSTAFTGLPEPESILQSPAENCTVSHAQMARLILAFDSRN